MRKRGKEKERKGRIRKEETRKNTEERKGGDGQEESRRETQESITPEEAAKT